MTKQRRKIDWGSNWWFLPIFMLALVFGMYIGFSGGRIW